ncbi:MAG: tetratricopeptide repeat protein [Deltaproteobacteria bacterium]|nr:tetratricopeptide repeat protein [Deltaproteobacteria bacterium]
MLRELLATARGATVTLRHLPRDPDDPSPEERLTRESATERVLRPLTTPDEAGAAHGVVHVVDATGSVPDDAWAWCFQRLNERRNVIAQRLHGELVLCVTPAQETQLAAIAPDLWSIRSGTFMVDVEAPLVAASAPWPTWRHIDRDRSEPDAEAERRRAEEELVQARAWAAGSPDDAGRKESVAIWLERLGTALEAEGRSNEAAAALSEAGALIEGVLAAAPERRELRHYLVALRLLMVDLATVQGRLDDAQHMLIEQVLPAVDDLGDGRARASALLQLADVFIARGQLEEALTLLEQESIPAFERLGDARSHAAAMGRVADIYEMTGQADEALRIRREVELPVYQQLGDDLARASTMGRIADSELSQGRLESAREILEREVLPANERLGHHEGIAFASWRLGEVLLRQNRPAEALPLVERAFDLLQRLGHAQGLAAVGREYIALLEQTGDADRAAAVRAAIEAHARRLGLA